MDYRRLQVGDHPLYSGTAGCGPSESRSDRFELYGVWSYRRDYNKTPDTT